MIGTTRFRRIICFLLTMVLLAGSISGCSGDKPAGDPSTSGIVKKPGGEADSSSLGAEAPDQSKSSSGTASEILPVITNAGMKDVLAIAKKYYDARLPLLHPDLKEEFKTAAGEVDFSGKERFTEQSTHLCNLSSVETAFRLNGDFAVLTAAAALAKDPNNPEAAHALSTVLLEAMFLGEAERLQDALVCVSYAASLEEAWQYYYTLAQIYGELGSYEEALKAIDHALELDPDNFVCIDFKVVLLRKIGGFGAAVKALEEEAGDKDGDLGKRLKKQEEATEGKTQPGGDDSKEELEKKFNEALALEPITIADMLEHAFPQEAAKLKSQIMTVTESDRIKLPKFPAKLFMSAKLIEEDCYNEVQEYIDWLNRSVTEMNSKANAEFKQAYQEASVQKPADVADIEKTITDQLLSDPEMFEHMSADDFVAWINQNVNDMLPEEADSSKSQLSLEEGSYSDETNVEIMMDYNNSVVNAAVWSFALYSSELRREFIEKAIKATQGMMDRILVMEKNKQAEMRNAPEEEKPIIALKWELAMNGACEDYVSELLPLATRDYKKISQMANDLWEDILPYIRGTRMPEAYISHYQAIIFTYSLNVLGEVDCLRSTPYKRYISEADLIAAQEALAEHRAYMKELAMAAANSGSEFRLSIDLVYVKINITPNNAELEALVGNVAARAQYDWKKGELELGGGVGAKIETGAKFIKFEAKMMANVVIDLKKKKISDIYLSSEASASMGNYGVEAGGKISVLGKGSSIYGGISAGRDPVSVSHRQELLRQE